MARIEINQSVFDEDRHYAASNRAILRERGWAAVNLVGSPGSGKTALLAAALPRLARSAFVITGDIEGSFDADRLAAAGIRAVQVNTHGACHLSPALVHEQLNQLDMPVNTLVIVENVGNLVCPAEVDLGLSGTLAVLSAAEGAEKPLKYPLLFQKADAVLLTKIDIAQACFFDIQAARQAALLQHPQARVLELSVVTGAGMAELIALLEAWRGV